MERPPNREWIKTEEIDINFFSLYPPNREWIKTEEIDIKDENACGQIQSCAPTYLVSVTQQENQFRDMMESFFKLEKSITEQNIVIVLTNIYTGIIEKIF